MTERLRSPEGPVWFSSILVRNPASSAAGHTWDGTKITAGMTPPAVYEVDWKVTRNG